MTRTYHEDGTLPENDEIFVFGSNLAGRHGAGAALVAHQKYDFPLGIGDGPHGRAYAIPTKDEHLATLPLSEIRLWVHTFIWYAAKRESDGGSFFVTSIGCGLAGYKPEEIAPLFGIAPLRKLPGYVEGPS